MDEELFVPPLVVQYELTAHCNLFCNMCYNGSGGNQKNVGELSKDEWRRVVEETARLGILEAIVSGGEPLTRGLEFVSDLLDILTEHDVATTLITNGWYITEAFVKKITANKLQHVQVSIDGSNAEIHDQIRGKSGSFERAVKAAHTFSKAGVKLRISCVLQRTNWHMMRDMCELAVAIGATEIAFDEFMPIGRGNENFEKIALPRDTRTELIANIDYLRDVYAPFLTILEGYERQTQLNQLSSTAMAEGVVIRPDGQLRMNCVAPFTTGNIREEGFRQAWSKALRAWHRPNMKDYVNSVSDNFSLRDVYSKLGVIKGQENVQVS